MTKTQADLLRRAVEILNRLVPDDGEPRAINSVPRRCPMAKFANKFLARDPVSDMSTAELFQFYAEIASSGELDRISQSEFFRRLPAVMESVYNVRKSHNIQRSGSRVRGFKGITIRGGEADYAPATLLRGVSSNP